MARTTSTQRGASRRTTRSASGGPGARAAAPSRSRKPAASRARKTAAPVRIPRPSGPWVPVMIVALVGILAWSLYPALRLQYQASRRMAGLEQQYDSLKKRNDTLRAQVAELKTPQGVEKAAREDLGYAKSGEHVYVVVPSKGSTATPATGSQADIAAASATDTSAPTLLQMVLDALFGVGQPTSTVAP